MSAFADNAQKVPFARSANEIARKKALDAIMLTGKALPASIVSIAGWIATVKFELDAKPWTLQNVVVPVASSLYDYLPLQEGDPGVLRAADARLGGLSELGGGVAKLDAKPANLATLVFEPFGKKSWSPPSDPAVRVVQGPNGVTIQTLDGSSTIVLTKTDIKMTRGGTAVELDGTKVNVTGELWINGKKYLNHEHSGVQAGSSDSGGVVDP